MIVIELHTTHYSMITCSSIALYDTHLKKIEDFISKLEQFKEVLISFLNKKGSDKDILAITEELMESEADDK